MSASQQFDVIIIGGGATGLGCAVEAQSRGYQTLLLEARDYGSGTSSKSTKLVHGGIRYLVNFDFALVKEGLEERHYFLHNAPHLAHRQSYLVPFHNRFESLKYHLGIWLYDFLAGHLKIGKSQFLAKAATLHEAPDLKPELVCSSGLYWDGQFDDTRMLVSLLKTFESLGGAAFNYQPVVEFIEKDGKISGVKTAVGIEFTAPVVINATGIFTDSIANLAEPQVSHHEVEPAQGTHLVFDKTVFDCAHALVIPKTIDGRILFALPWHDKVLVGTTDVEMPKPDADPIPQAEEVELILRTFGAYTKHPLTLADVRSQFAGQRPLVKPVHAKNSKKVSRKHEILMTQNGLISIVGGKWTIYRRMGEDTINYAIQQGLLKPSQSRTKEYQLVDAAETGQAYPLSVYGSAYTEILAIQQQMQNFAKLHPSLPYLQAEVIYQVKHEQARTLEDVLARRTRALFLDAKAAIAAAPIVAELMAIALNQDAAWQQQALTDFMQVAQTFVV